MESKVTKKKPYDYFTLAAMIILAILFAFPLYWIITGAFKDTVAINAVIPEWFPKEATMVNFEKLMKKPAFLWLWNAVFISAMSMILTCATAAMAGYALAKKRFIGQTVIFTLLICAMALPKQVVLVPLLKEMSFLGLHDNVWAVILPTVGWPFGVFLLKQFSEGIPTEMLEAVRIDGAGEVQTFTTMVLPMIKPGIGALAIFTFISTWNDYFLQLIMLNSSKVLTISLGIAKLQAENSSDFGLIMAGASLAAVPIVAIFIMFQKYFTQGITMGAVKG